MQAKVIQVIETFDNRGRGTNEDPVRNVKQFWSFDGELLMEDDSWFFMRKMNRLEKEMKGENEN